MSNLSILFASMIVGLAFAGQIIREEENYRYTHLTWPDLIGTPTDTAESAIRDEYPSFTIEFRLARNGISSTILPNHVILYEDDIGRVAHIPETINKVRHTIDYRRWPEVVGLTADAAQEIILKELPEAQIVVVEEGSPVTADFVENRVRLFVNDDYVVVLVPFNG